MSLTTGTRVRLTNLEKFSGSERGKLEGKTGIIAGIEGQYFKVRLDEDVDMTIRNDVLVLPDELEAYTMSVYKVERVVDTVRMEMDVSVAEKLLEILDLVQDDTRQANSTYGSDINELRARLSEDAEVRYPSPLYRATVHGLGYVTLKDKI